ncbi:MAG: type IV pilus assembly protein PilM [Miltoncostaeaceae bacterium]
MALDVGSSAVAGVELRSQGAKVKLARAELMPLPSGLMSDGEVVDPEGLSRELRSFWKLAGFRGKRVRLGVANQRVVVRTIEVPATDDREARKAVVEAEAADKIPMPSDRSVIDFQPIERLVTDEGATDRVIVVAAHRDMVEGMVAVARRAGLVPTGIDLEAFALLRALLPHPGVLDAGSPDTPAQAVCHIGAEITNVIVSVDRRCHFTRLIGFGGSRLTAAIAEQTGADPDVAEKLKVGSGLVGPAPEGWDPEVVRSCQRSLAQGARPLAEEISRSLGYYFSQPGSRPIDRLVLVGGTARCAGIDRYLAQALNLPVELGDPLATLDGSTPVSPDVAARAAVAVGLAMDSADAA